MECESGQFDWLSKTPETRRIIVPRSSRPLIINLNSKTGPSEAVGKPECLKGYVRISYSQTELFSGDIPVLSCNAWVPVLSLYAGVNR